MFSPKYMRIAYLETQILATLQDRCMILANLQQIRRQILANDSFQDQLIVQLENWLAEGDRTGIVLEWLRERIRNVQVATEELWRERQVAFEKCSEAWIKQRELKTQLLMAQRCVW